MWNTVVGAWAAGHREIPSQLQAWAASYSGTGDGAVELGAFPEPYIGALATGTPSVVMLGLNPGAADLALQGADGSFTRQIARTSYAEWATNGAHTSAEWEEANGRNRYHRSRLAFARRWREDETLTPASALYVELYSWHSRRVTSAIAPPQDALWEWVWEPIGAIDVPMVFAFGQPWIAAAGLGLGQGREVDAEWATPSRHAVLFDLPTRQQKLVVLHQRGYAGPPGAEDTRRLRAALG